MHKPALADIDIDIAEDGNIPKNNVDVRRYVLSRGGRSGGVEMAVKDIL